MNKYKDLMMSHGQNVKGISFIPELLCPPEAQEKAFKKK